MAFLFGFVGLFYNPFLVFIAFFVWIGAAQESRIVQMRAAVEGILVSHVMLTNFDVLSANDRLGDAVRLVLSGSQQDFPVVEDGRIVGVLTHGDLLRGLQQQGDEAPVSTVMQKEFIVSDSYDMLEAAFERLQTCERHTVPVIHDGALVGLITMHNAGEFLLIQTALGVDSARA